MQLQPLSTTDLCAEQHVSQAGFVAHILSQPLAAVSCGCCSWKQQEIREGGALLS